MKKFLVPLLLLILAACTQAPTPDDGGRLDLAPLVFGGPGDEGVSDLAKHATGVFAVGFTTNTPTFDSQGNPDVFIRKYSSSRSVIWTRKFGTADFEFVGGAASDGSDNVYVAYSVLAESGEVVFIRKYRADGQLAWIRQFGSSRPNPDPNEPFPPAQNFPKGLATYGSNAVYVVGGTDGKLSGSVGEGGVFIRKYTAGGSVIWTRQFGFTEDEFSIDYVSDVAVDGSGNAYVVGSTDRSLGGPYGYDMFIRKYSSSGSVLWTRQLNFSIDDSAEAVAVSGSNVYLGVRYVRYVPDAGNSVTDESGIRIVKFSTSGVRAQGWGYVYNSVGPDYVEDLDTDRDGNVYFSGGTQATVPGDTDGFVVKLKPSGARVWSKRVASSGNEYANAVLARTTSEVYVAGFTDGVLGAANRGNTDPFLRRLRGSDGSTVWTEQ